MELKRILHPTDFSVSARPAFERAVILCERTGAELHLLHVTETLGSDPIRGAFDARLDEESFYARMYNRADEEMQALSGEAEARGLRVKRVHSHGTTPADVILDYAKEQALDLIVVGTHGRRGFRRMLAGSVAMEVVRRARAPVMTVSARSKKAADATFGRILVPVDFSSHARTALGCARSLAMSLGSELHVLHVIERPVFPAFYEASVEMMYGNMEGMLDEARSELRHVIATIDELDVPTTIEVVHGNAVESILEVATAKRSDLIVLSTHGLTGIPRFFLGSVSERIIRTSSIPTLRIRTLEIESAQAPAGESEQRNTHSSVV